MRIIAPPAPNAIITATGEIIQTLIADIPAWNMKTAQYRDVDISGVPLSKIIAIHGVIITDNGIKYTIPGTVTLLYPSETSVFMTITGNTVNSIVHPYLTQLVTDDDLESTASNRGILYVFYRR